MKRAFAAWALLFVAASSGHGLVAAKGPDVTSLSWLVGTWEGRDAQGVEMEELWTAPKGGTMLALHRDVKDGRTVSFEYLRIETGPDGLVYQASPRGRPATPFRLKEWADKRVVFENPEHDFPQRVLYWMAGDGALHARIEGTHDGKAASEEWSWRRTK
jgi:hypothetical protein